MDGIIPTTATEKAEVLYHQVSTSTIRASETNDEPLSLELTHGRRQNTTKCHSLPPFSSSEGTKIQATVSKALQGEGSVIQPQTDAGSRGEHTGSVPPRRSCPLPRGTPGARGTPGLPAGAPRSRPARALPASGQPSPSPAVPSGRQLAVTRALK